MILLRSIFFSGILFCGALCQGADTPVPLINGNFENGLEGWKLNATNPLVAQVLPAAASLGDKGLRLQSTPDCQKFDLISSPMPVKPKKSYTVELWGGGSSESEPGAGVDVTMIFRDAEGKDLKPDIARIRKWPAIGVQGGDRFADLLLAAAAPENAVNLFIQISSSGRKGATGLVDIDDISVMELSDEVPPPIPPGQGHPIPPFDPARVKALEDEVSKNPTRGKPVSKIVIKLDDLKPTKGGVHPKWIKAADFAKTRGFKINFGIIASTMVEDCPEFVRWVKEKHDAGEIEFWNHGWDHGERTEGVKKIQEFGGESYEYQKKHMTDANNLMREKMGFPFVSFGAPFNSTDEQTVKVLTEDPDIKVWMYGDPKNPAGKVVLKRNVVTIETPTLIPNYAAFLEGYAHNRGAEYFVMQGHPAGWDDDRWGQFVKIIDFLQAQKAEFVFASDFVPKEPAK